MTEITIVSYCDSCDTVYNTSKPQTTCAICKGQLDEMGWVEQNGR